MLSLCLPEAIIVPSMRNLGDPCCGYTWVVNCGNCILAEKRKQIGSIGRKAASRFLRLIAAVVAELSNAGVIFLALAV